MAENESLKRPVRRSVDDPEVIRYDFLNDVQRIVEKQGDRVLEALEEHKADPYAHMAAASQYRTTYTDAQTRLTTLWDERNEMKGMIKVWLPVLGLISPIVAGVLVVILIKVFHL